MYEVCSDPVMLVTEPRQVSVPPHDMTVTRQAFDEGWSTQNREDLQRELLPAAANGDELSREILVAVENGEFQPTYACST